jgi:hypothetical protein
MMLAVVRINSSSPSHNFSPPQPEFDVVLEKRLQDILFDLQAKEEVNVRADMVRKAAGFEDFPLPGPRGPEIILNFAEHDVLLAQEDVPLLQGLCYRIHEECEKLAATPGKRICLLVDHSTKGLVARAAQGQALDRAEREELFAALNAVLHRTDFVDANSFRGIRGAVALVLMHGLMPDAGDKPVVNSPRFNRLILDKCYPHQIVPLHQRDQLDAFEQEQWLRRAQTDLSCARLQYEPTKR